MPLWPKLSPADVELLTPLTRSSPARGNAHPGFVYFDAGMVLVDLDWEAFFMGLASHFESGQLNQERFLTALLGSDLLGDWECGRSGPAAFASRLAKALEESLQGPAPVPTTLEIKTYSSRILGDLRTPVLELARQLKAAGYGVGILSNASPWHETDLLLKADLCSLFEPRLFSQDLGCAKPDPRIYALAESYARRSLGLEDGTPLTFYFVDDTPANVRAARQAGWRAALVDLLADKSLWKHPELENLSRQKAQLVFGEEAARRVRLALEPLL